jgi:hypothetical protein
MIALEKSWRRTTCVFVHVHVHVHVNVNVNELNDTMDSSLTPGKSR